MRHTVTMGGGSRGIRRAGPARDLEAGRLLRRVHRPVAVHRADRSPHREPLPGRPHRVPARHARAVDHPGAGPGAARTVRGPVDSSIAVAGQMRRIDSMCPR